MKAIEVISIPVSDQEAAREFYQKLGFRVIAEGPLGNGQYWVQLGIPHRRTSITLVNWWPFKRMAAGSLQGLMLETDDIEKDVEALKSKGIEVADILDSPHGKFASVNDPDGNGLMLHENKMDT